MSKILHKRAHICSLAFHLNGNPVGTVYHPTIQMVFLCKPENKWPETYTLHETFNLNDECC